MGWSSPFLFCCLASWPFWGPTHIVPIHFIFCWTPSELVSAACNPRYLTIDIQDISIYRPTSFSVSTRMTFHHTDIARLISLSPSRGHLSCFRHSINNYFRMLFYQQRQLHLYTHYILVYPSLEYV